MLHCFVELQMLMTQTSNLNSPLGASGVHSPTQLREQAGSDILDSDVEKIQLDKSNILLLGPTGSGKKNSLLLLMYWNNKIMMFRGEVWLEFYQSGCGRIKYIKKRVKISWKYITTSSRAFQVECLFWCLSISYY